MGEPQVVQEPDWRSLALLGLITPVFGIFLLIALAAADVHAMALFWCCWGGDLGLAGLAWALIIGSYLAMPCDYTRSE